MPDSPTQSTNLQGQTVASGRFVIVNLLGSGGMADVYRAYDNRTNRDVAVKTPKLNLLADEEFVKRFDREIKIMVGLEHPHIVPVLFAGKHEGHTFAVFPYLTGGSLGDRIKSGNPYAKPPTTTADLYWLTQIALALDYLHGQGLLHRDVKPDNILFDADGKAYLSDFGIVRALDAEKGGKAVTQLTAANGTIGTPQYMALELLLAKTPYSGAVDQYALAVTVYQALTGDRPYNGTFEQIVFQQARTKPPALAKARPDLPPLVGEAVHRALAKSPGRRFASCVEFAQAVVRGVPTPTIPTATPVVGTLLSSGETARAPTDLPTQRQQPRRAGRSRRSAATGASPTRQVAPHDYRGPFSGALRRWHAKHWYLVGAAAAVLLALTLLFISLLRPGKRDAHVAKNTQSPHSPVNPIPPPNKPPSNNKDNEAPPFVEPKPKPQLPKQKKEQIFEPKAKPKPKSPGVTEKEKNVTDYAPPRPEVVPIAEFESAPLPNDTLVQLDKKNRWRRLNLRNSAVISNRPLVSLPGRRSVVKIADKFRLTLWGQLPELWVFRPPPLFEAAVELHPNSDFDLDLTLKRGRIIIGNLQQDGMPRVRLRLVDPTNPAATQYFDFKFETPGAELMAELAHDIPPGEPFYKDPDDPKREGPYAALFLLAKNGEVFVNRNNIGFRLTAPPSNSAFYFWHSVQGDSNPLAMNMIPKALENPPIPSKVDKTYRREMLKATEDFSSELIDTKPVQVLLAEWLKAPPTHVARRHYAVRCLAALGSYEYLLDALDNPKYPRVRREAVDSIRRWMAMERNNEYLLFEALQKKYNSTTQADRMMDLFHKYSKEALQSPDTYQVLIDLLNDSQFIVRELAYSHLHELVPAGRSIPYSAAAESVSRQQAQAAWRKLIPPGKLPPTG